MADTSIVTKYSINLPITPNEIEDVQLTITDTGGAKKYAVWFNKDGMQASVYFTSKFECEVLVSMLDYINTNYVSSEPMDIHNKFSIKHQVIPQVMPEAITDSTVEEKTKQYLNQEIVPVVNTKNIDLSHMDPDPDLNDFEDLYDK
jgi:hypothetical protein